MCASRAWRFVGLADTFVIAAYDIVPTVFPDGRHQFLQHAGVPDVVAVEKTDVVALCMADTRLTGPGSSLVDSPYYDDARVALRVAACHGLRTVRRPVIDDDSLEIPVRLPSDRIEAGIEIVFQVVNRNNDRYPRALIFPFLHLCNPIYRFHDPAAGSVVKIHVSV